MVWLPENCVFLFMGIGFISIDCEMLSEIVQETLYLGDIHE